MVAVSLIQNCGNPKPLGRCGILSAGKWTGQMIANAQNLSSQGFVRFPRATATDLILSLPPITLNCGVGF